METILVIYWEKVFPLGNAAGKVDAEDHDNSSYICKRWLLQPCVSKCYKPSSQGHSSVHRGNEHSTLNMNIIYFVTQVPLSKSIIACHFKQHVEFSLCCRECNPRLSVRSPCWTSRSTSFKWERQVLMFIFHWHFKVFFGSQTISIESTNYQSKKILHLANGKKHFCDSIPSCVLSVNWLTFLLGKVQ